MEGYKATTKLLKGAYPLFTTKKTTSYWKSGDFATAIADFKSVSPSHVRDLMLVGVRNHLLGRVEYHYVNTRLGKFVTT